MAEIDKLSMEEIKEFVDYFKDTIMFDSVNISFLEGLYSVLDHSNKKMQNVEFPEVEEDVPKLKENDVIKTCEEFYSKLSPELHDIVYNSGRRANYKIANNHKSKDFNKEPITILTSSSDTIVLDNTYKSVIVTVHENVHRMTKADQFADYNNSYYDEQGFIVYPDWHPDFEDKANSSFDSYFDELDAIYAEMLCNDFLNEKYGKELTGIYKPRFLAQKELSENVSEKDCEMTKEPSMLDYYKSIIGFAKFIEEEPLNEMNIDKYREALKKLDDEIMIHIYWYQKESLFDKGFYNEFIALNRFTRGDFCMNHEMDFLFANYIHQNADMKNPELAKETLDKLIHINALSSDFTQEQVELLANIGIPFTIVDGKLGMDQKCIDAINSAFDKTLENYQSRFGKTLESDKPRNDKIFSMEKITRESLENAIDEEEVERVEAEEREIQLGENEQEEESMHQTNWR